MSSSLLPVPAGHTVLWLARHGEVHNPNNVLYARLPRMRLSAEGERQAQALARFLAPRPLAAIYSSPMLRARKTAEVVATHHPDVNVSLDRGLLEIRTGWQGHPITVLDEIGWDFYSNPVHPEDDRLPTVRDRMQGWVERVLRRHGGQEVVGVSHGDPILILLGHLRGLPMDLARIRPREYPPTACLFRLEFDRQGRLVQEEMFVPHQQAAA